MILPATKTNTLVDEINVFLTSASTHADTSEFWFKRIANEATKLLKVSPAEGHNVLANLYGAAGDYEKAVYHIDVALRLSNSPHLWSNKAVISSNLGFFSQAQKVFEVAASPEHGLFPERIELGTGIGAFHKVVEFGAMALRMKLSFDLEKLRLSQRAATLMDEVVVTDNELAAMLDVAGEILRQERLFFMGRSPDVFVWDQDALEKHLAINFRVPVSSQRALALDRELGHRLLDEIANLPFQVMLHFESGLPQNERFAEQSIATI